MTKASGTRQRGVPEAIKRIQGKLFVTDSFDRVEVGGFLGGIPAEENAGHGADNERKADRIHLDGNRPMGENHDEPRSDEPDEDADDAACDADDYGLDEELRKDVDATGTDGHAQANLTGALGD